MVQSNKRSRRCVNRRARRHDRIARILLPGFATLRACVVRSRTKAPHISLGGLFSFTTHQHVQTQLKYVKVNTSHTLHSLHSYARDMQRVPRSQTRFRVAIPRVNPGSEPVQPPRLTGVWTVADTHTGMGWDGMVWYGLGLRLKASSSSLFSHKLERVAHTLEISDLIPVRVESWIFEHPLNGQLSSECAGASRHLVPSFGNSYRVPTFM